MKKVNLIFTVVFSIVILQCGTATALETADTKTEGKSGGVNPFIPRLPPKLPPVKPAEKIQTEIKKQEKIAEATITPPEVTISGLIWNSNRPQAIVNDKIVDIGDTINDITIVNIKKYGIDIVYQGKSFTILKRSPLVAMYEKRQSN